MPPLIKQLATRYDRSVTSTGLSGEQVRRALLDQNYVPRASRRGDDLPPSFDTLGFNSASASISQRYVKNQGHVKDVSRSRWPGYSVAKGRVAHYRLNPRRIELPHPVAYANLVETIARHWDSEIAPRLVSPVSQFSVRQHSDGRIASMQQSRPPLRPGVGSRFRIRADVANFYDSIYTHAVPWAMLGKSEAKTSRNLDVAANDIDAALRFARRGETTGVSVGPGTSLIIAEIMLGKIDEGLEGFRYDRFLDDYIGFASSETEAEEFVQRLDVGLREYGLMLNARKTVVEALPLPDEPAWIRELRRATRDRPGELLDRAIEMAHVDPAASGIRWVLSRLTKMSQSFSDHDAQQIMLRLAELSYTHPYTTSALVQMLESRGAVLNARDLDSLLIRHSTNIQTSAVCWLLHHAWSSSQPISQESWTAVVGSGDALAMSFLLKSKADRHAANRAALLAQLRKASDDYALDEVWPARYVAFLGGVEELSDPGFDEMRSVGVQLLRDPRRESGAQELTPPQSENSEPATSDDEVAELYELGLSG